MLTSSHSVPDKRWHDEAAKGTLSAYEVAALLSPNNPDPARVSHLLTARPLLGVLHEGEMGSRYTSSMGRCAGGDSPSRP